MADLLSDAAARASRYLAALPQRSVVPNAADIARLSELNTAWQDEPCDPADVLALLDTIGSPATVASAGPRYFGFVTGGTLPAALAANWMAAAWDQNGALRVMSPVSAALEEITVGWLRDLFGLPASTGVGFVTGATMANFTCLAAARHTLLRRSGWNVEDDGLFSAPPVRVLVSDEVHVSLLKALSMLGLGRSRVIRVPCDQQGRMLAEKLPELDERSIVCLQAGNVNSGAFDPAEEICARAAKAGAWVHIDGAFGLWAAAAPARRELLRGFERADSWATDCHKWLNVSYDSGLALVRDERGLRGAMSMSSAAYLHTTSEREPAFYTPEASRRARGIEVWAALRSLGRSGLAELVERNCRLARRAAGRLHSAGCTILNDVVLNQVLVSFGSDAETERRVSELQALGNCWCGMTNWHGRAAMRISVSNWATAESDIDQSFPLPEM